jgi:hypothetical protein
MLVASGCGSAALRGGVTSVTVAASPGSSTAAGPTTRPTPPPVPWQTGLGGTCDSLLPVPDIEHALGRMFSGRNGFIVGVPERSIGRIAYLNCRYGMPPNLLAGPAQPLSEIGVSLYRTAAQAQERVRGTVFDYLGNGAAQSRHAVAGSEAVLLTGATGPGYEAPLLVLAAGQRTIAVSLAIRAGTAAFLRRALVALAELALTRTAG